MQKFEDIMFDTDPLELADELADLEKEIKAIICTDEEAEGDEEIFFGLPTEIGEIIEIRARVESCSEIADDEYEITVAVTAVDSTMLKLASDTLLGRIKKSADGEPVWAAGFKQQDNSYAILANSPGGIISAEQLAKIAEISAAGVGSVKLTHAQRVVILVKVEQVEAATTALESVGMHIGVLHHGIRNVRACCGALCRFAQKTNCKPLAQEIADRFFGRSMAFDIKIAISDCMRNCSESYCADIGLIADKGSYSIVIGGRGSQVPFRALNLISGVKPEEATDMVEKVINWYTANANKGERLHKLLHRLGSAEAIDTTGLEEYYSKYNDGIDEFTRTQEQFTRINGLKQLQTELGL